MEMFTIGTKDSFGEKTVRLISNERKSRAKEWRKRKIDESERKGIKELLVKAGEFGAGLVETVKYALDKGFSVTVVAGNKTYCESRDECISFLNDFPTSFKYYVLNDRPSDHFAIIGQTHLFIEVPHAWNAKNKDSIGITNAHYHILEGMKKKFENTIKMAKNIDISKEDDINYLNAMTCFLKKNN